MQPVWDDFSPLMPQCLRQPPGVSTSCWECWHLLQELSFKHIYQNQGNSALGSTAEQDRHDARSQHSKIVPFKPLFTSAPRKAMQDQRWLWSVSLMFGRGLNKTLACSRASRPAFIPQEFLVSSPLSDPDNGILWRSLSGCAFPPRLSKILGNSFFWPCATWHGQSALIQLNILNFLMQLLLNKSCFSPVSALCC